LQQRCERVIRDSVSSAFIGVGQNIRPTRDAVNRVHSSPDRPPPPAHVRHGTAVPYGRVGIASMTARVRTVASIGPRMPDRTPPANSNSRAHLFRARASTDRPGGHYAGRRRARLRRAESPWPGG
jgi:hypothetical protein